MTLKKGCDNISEKKHHCIIVKNAIFSYAFAMDKVAIQYLSSVMPLV
jgi:hypothetical protein